MSVDILQVGLAAAAGGVTTFVVGRVVHALDRSEGKAERTDGKIERVDLTARAAVDRVERELTAVSAKLDNRLARVEETIKHLPTDEEIRRLTDRLSGVEKETAGMNAKLESQGELLRTIRDHILEGERS